MYAEFFYLAYCKLEPSSILQIMIGNWDFQVVNATRQTVGQVYNKPLLLGSKKLSATQLNAMSRNQVIPNNFQKLQLREGNKRIQETGDPASLSSS